VKHVRPVILQLLQHIFCLSGSLFPRSYGLFSVGLTCPAPLCPRLILILFRVHPGHICLHYVYGCDFLTAHPQNDNDLLPHHHRFHPWRHLQSDQKLSGNSLSCFACVSKASQLKKFSTSFPFLVSPYAPIYMERRLLTFGIHVRCC
jgi:hypothetical protein